MSNFPKSGSDREAPFAPLSKTLKFPYNTPRQPLRERSAPPDYFFMMTLLIGYCATVVGSLLLVPQVIKTYKTRRVHDLSFLFIILYILNSVLWLAYGLLIDAKPVAIANAVALALCIAQLVFKLRFRDRGEDLT
jgi:MtN3 and saliva related transmembrane protein